MDSDRQKIKMELLDCVLARQTSSGASSAASSAGFADRFKSRDILLSDNNFMKSVDDFFEREGFKGSFWSGETGTEAAPPAPAETAKGGFGGFRSCSMGVAAPVAPETKKGGLGGFGSMDELALKFQSSSGYIKERLDQLFKSSDWMPEQIKPSQVDVDPQSVFDRNDEDGKATPPPTAPIPPRRQASSKDGKEPSDDRFKSSDWKPDYESSHVDVNPSVVFQSEEDRLKQKLEGASTDKGDEKQKKQKQQPPAAKAATTRPVGGKGTDWNALFEAQLPPKAGAAAATSSPSAAVRAAAARSSELSAVAKAMTLLSSSEDVMPPLKDATTIVPPVVSLAAEAIPPAVPENPLRSPGKGGRGRAKASASRRPNKRRKPDPAADDAFPGSKRAVVQKTKKKRRGMEDPEEKRYYEPCDKDVLLGRGGRTNHHAGNKRYLDEKADIQDRYLAASKEEKTAISQELVDRVWGWGGKFLELDTKRKEWFEVTAIKARKKASQTLRELNTPEERAAKRARYNR